MLEQLERFGKKMAQFQRQFVEDEVAGEEWVARRATRKNRNGAS